MKPLKVLIKTVVFSLVIALFAVLICCAGNADKFSSLTRSAPKPHLSEMPEMAKWREQMVSYGSRHCSALLDHSIDFESKLASTYYDAQWVFFQIGDYTSNPKWDECAAAAGEIYGQKWVNEGGEKTPGYWIFPHGLKEDFIRNGNLKAKEALLRLSHKSAFAGDEIPLEWTVDAGLSREVAYMILTYLNAEDIGEERRIRLDHLVEQALGHLNQWFLTKDTEYVRPFMVGLTAHALIEYFEKTKDPRIFPILSLAADWLWENTWIPSKQAFMYTDREHESGGMEATSDLNLLIAPMYGWLYSQSREVKYARQGDDIFAGGVEGAFLSGAKQFNQNYRWSFQYLRWRHGRLP